MEDFLFAIRQFTYYATFFFVGVGILMILALLVKLVTIKQPKDKYDFINRYERDMLWYSTLSFIVAGGCYVTSILSTEPLYIFVGIFISVMFGMIIGVIIYNYLKFYYPTFIEKRLHRLRYQPRVNPRTGNKMKLLSEDEEDVYLDEGMQAEENIFSVDYDVWIDEETGFTKIEKYQGHLHALKSPMCGYYTLRVVREEIIESPTEDKEGTLIKYYECSYTGYKTQKVFNIAKLKKSKAYERSSLTSA